MEEKAKFPDENSRLYSFRTQHHKCGSGGKVLVPLKSFLGHPAKKGL